MYRFHEAIDATNAALGAHLSMDVCFGWGKHLRSLWEMENFAQVGASSGGDLAVLTAAITQILPLIGAIERTLAKLVGTQEQQSRQHSTREQEQEATSPAPQLSSTPSDVSAEAATLAAYVYSWYTLSLWRTATIKKQQFARADLKACVNIMMILGGRELHVPAASDGHGTIAHQLWKHTVWTLAEELDSTANDRLHALNGKHRIKTAGSHRKRLGQLRVNSRSEYDVLCTNFLALKSTGSIVGNCTLATHQWSAQDPQ